MFSKGQIVKTNVWDQNNNDVTVDVEFEEYLAEKKDYGTSVLDCVITCEGIKVQCDSAELFA